MYIVYRFPSKYKEFAYQNIYFLNRNNNLQIESTFLQNDLTILQI